MCNFFTVTAVILCALNLTYALAFALPIVIVLTVEVACDNCLTHNAHCLARTVCLSQAQQINVGGNPSTDNRQLPVR